jgi:hypothetical protein
MHSYGVCTILRITTDYFPKEQKWNVTCNGDATCFLCGRNWSLKYYSDSLWLQKVNVYSAMTTKMLNCYGNLKSDIISSRMHKYRKPYDQKWWIIYTLTLAAKNQLGWITPTAWISGGKLWVNLSTRWHYFDILFTVHHISCHFLFTNSHYTLSVS